MCANPVSGNSFPSGDATSVPGGQTPARGMVLIVEDNDFVAGVVSCILKRMGQPAVRARDGAECETLIAQHTDEIRLVLADCGLPDTDGISLCTRLRERRPELPILLSSGHNYAGPRGLAGGPTAFLAKPFLPSQLQEQIDSLLRAAA